MQKIINGDFEGERSLFKAQDLEIRNTIFHDGESPLKESNNIKLNKVEFKWKYPLWYSKNIKVSNSIFRVMSRSGIWYTSNISLKDTIVEAPKEFRRSDRIKITNCKFLDATETLWSCDKVKIKDSYFKGDYLLMNSKNIEIDNMVLDGNYCFDGGRNIVIRNSILNSKDSFWNATNVLVENSTITGEYIGWNSKNVTFRNCKIESNQGFCYMENLVLEDCVLVNTTLAFEYSSVNAKINSHIDSVKNPIKGRIECDSIGELILDDCDKNNIEIVVKHEN